MTKSSFPLPQDWRDAVLVGRIDMGEGPTPIVVKEGRVFDVSKAAPTVSELLEKWNGVPQGKDLGDINDLGLETAWSNGAAPKVKLLAPVDLQCVKAAGVTFAVSAMERVIEERAKGLTMHDRRRNRDCRVNSSVRTLYSTTGWGSGSRKTSSPNATSAANPPIPIQIARTMAVTCFLFNAKHAQKPTTAAAAKNAKQYTISPKKNRKHCAKESIRG